MGTEGNDCIYNAGDGANLVKSTLTLSKYFRLRNIVTILSFFIQHVV